MTYRRTPRKNHPRIPVACARDTASAVLITDDSRSTGDPFAVNPGYVGHKQRDQQLGHCRILFCGYTGSTQQGRRFCSHEFDFGVEMAIGCTVSELKRRLSAALISLTPRSRVFAVAITLKPSRA